jgi:hypothetical protein
MRRGILLLFLLLAGTYPAGAQTLTDEQKAKLLADRWAAIFGQLIAENRLQLVDASGRTVRSVSGAQQLNGAPDDVRTVYTEAIRRLMMDPVLRVFFEPDLTRLDEVSAPTDQVWVAKLAASAIGAKGAKSVNAPLTSPAAPRSAERSGFTDLVSLALDTKNIVSANESAVTVSLNALALVGLKSETRSAPALYREHSTLRRLGGSFSFGAKIPEGEITGLTGLPSADTILDAVAWDAKVRVYGDRDPRAKQWYDPMLGYMGGLGEISANLLNSILPGDRRLVASLLSDNVGQALKIVKERLSKSAQVSIKAGGQHLTKETGKNKYTLALLADKGFGNTDLTANAVYSIVDDVAVSPGSVVTLKTWSGAVAINHVVAEDFLVQGRATELSFNAKFDIPFDDSGVLPTDRKKVWRLVGSVALPWGDAATIPVSITLASDPNSLTKQKYVTGHIGITYDFGALKSLFKPKAVAP